MSQDKPKVHEVKCLPEYFEAAISGIKPFTIRDNDRDYQVGDTIFKQEWTRESGYTGRDAAFTVTYITDYDQQPGVVVMGIKLQGSRDWNKVQPDSAEQERAEARKAWDAAEQRERIAKKIMQIDSFADTEECNFPILDATEEAQKEWLETFLRLLGEHVRGVLDEEIIDSLDREEQLISEVAKWEASSESWKHECYAKNAMIRQKDEQIAKLIAENERLKKALNKIERNF